MTQEAGFTALECRLTMPKADTTDNQFTAGTSYPILATFERGNHVLEGQHAVYFAQTTFQVVNDLGDTCYVPYSSSDYFVKKKAAVTV